MLPGPPTGRKAPFARLVATWPKGCSLQATAGVGTDAISGQEVIFPSEQQGGQPWVSARQWDRTCRPTGPRRR